MICVYEELADVSRRKLLSELRTGPKTVSELVRLVDLKQPNVSNHLRRMKEHGVVKDSKVGRHVYYSLASSDVERIVGNALDAPVNDRTEVDLDRSTKDFARAAAQGEEEPCTAIIDLVLRARLPIRRIYSQLLQPALDLIGTWYSVGAIDEAQEHMASEITMRLMARTLQATSPELTANGTVVLGCAEGAWHVIGLRMLADILRVRGWKTLYLGANVPINSFLSTVRFHKPRLVLVSCVSTDAVHATLTLVSSLAELKDKGEPYLIGVGGHGVAENLIDFADSRADFYSDSLDHFCDVVLPQIERTGKLDESVRSFLR